MIDLLKGEQYIVVATGGADLPSAANHAAAALTRRSRRQSLSHVTGQRSSGRTERMVRRPSENRYARVRLFATSPRVIAFRSPSLD
jgi:hypothetical protein